MKVLQIGKYYALSGGIEKVVYNLQEGLDNADIKCDIICIHNNILEKEDISTSSGKIYATKALFKFASTSFSVDLISKLKKIIKNYDIIQIHHPNPMGTLALFFAGIKNEQHLIVHWHSDIIKQKRLIKIFKPLQDWMLKRADVVVGTSKIYIEHSPYLKPYLHKIRSIPIGIDPFPITKLSIELKEKYKDKKVIFSLGRLCYYKGFDILISAAKFLPDDYIILIGGDGELKETLKKQIDNERVSDKVLLLGRVPDNKLSEYFLLCDIYCMSSVEKSEAFGVVLLEAFSLGKPVVATNIVGSGVNWVNQHEVSGYNVELNNPELLAEAIIMIICDKKKYQKYSKGALQRFNHNFKKQHMVDAFVQLYKGLSIE